MAMATVIVAAGVIVERDRVLLTQRKAGGHLEGLWEFPGGKADEGEDPRAAVVRELEEELGIHAVAGDILDVTFHHYVDVNRSVLLLFFEATRTKDSPEPTARDVAAFHWAAHEELGSLAFPPADLGILAKVKRLLATG